MGEGHNAVKLSRRLQAVAGMVTEGNVVCDIGCDHGFVSIYLIRKGISPKAIAMDVNSGPLRSAGEHVGEYGLTGYIETRLSDGTEALAAGEADTLICAGMGGKLTMRILEKGKNKVLQMKEIILQPQSEIRMVREYLRKAGYSIADESMVLEEDKYYPVIKALPDRKKSMNLPEGSEEACLEDKYGPVLLRRKDPVLESFLHREYDLCMKIMENLRTNGRQTQERQKEIAERMRGIEEALSRYYGNDMGVYMENKKSVTCGVVIGSLEQLCAPVFAESWDNVGLLAGRRDKEVEKICIALDATDAVVDEAVRNGADMLLTHHPLIFSSMKKINTDDFIGRRLVKLIQNDISYYAMHTNFDVMGMADAAADEIRLKERQVLSITYEDEIAKEGIGRYGKLPQVMTLEECASYVKEVFHLESVKIYGEKDTAVECAAISPGSGKSMIRPAVEAGAEVLITGDIEHHEGLDAVAQGLAIIDAGHYGLEKIFVPYMMEYIEREFPQIAVFAARERNPFWLV